MIPIPGYYKTRDGRKARVLCVDAPGNYPCVGYIVENGNVATVSWLADGSFRYYDGLDLIEPWTEPKPKKRIELRRALMRVVGVGVSELPYYISEYTSSSSAGHGFIRWLDEDPLVIEVEEE